MVTQVTNDYFYLINDIFLLSIIIVFINMKLQLLRLLICFYTLYFIIYIL